MSHETQVWTWLLVALMFCLAEVASGVTLVAAFFALGALLAAGATALWPTGGLAAAVVVFVGGSTLPLLAVRKPLLQWAQRRARLAPVDELTGSRVVPLQRLAPGAQGTGTLRGTRWQIRNVGVVELPADEPAFVVAREGLVLLLTGEPPSAPKPPASKGK